VQNLVALHGGSFELRSELRKGTEAIVGLPRTRMLQTVPPLQQLAEERHRHPAAETPQWRRTSFAADAPATGAGPSTVAP
jgi:two-component system cell cycle sensor histidine kinase PleC